MDTPAKVEEPQSFELGGPASNPSSPRLAEPAINPETTALVPSTHNWQRHQKANAKGHFLIFTILVASLGSFMFGLNISLLNTSLSTINSEYLTCGPRDSKYDSVRLLSEENCLANDLCKNNCIQYDVKNKNQIKVIRCPGGQADLTCSWRKWSDAIVTCVLFLGAAIGSMVGGRCIKYGRRKMFLVTMGIFVVGIISSITSNSISALVWARAIVGVAVGLISVGCPTYMAEVTPAEKRGKYGVLHQFMITVGIFVPMLLGLALEDPSIKGETWELRIFDKVWWRVMLGFGLIPVILALYLFIHVFDFETPEWYAENGRIEDTKALLALTHNKEDVTAEVKQIVAQIEESKKYEENRMTLKDIFMHHGYRTALIIGCTLSLFQQFGGINVFMASSNDIFAKAGFDGQMRTIFSVIMGLINIVMVFPTVLLIEKVGRRSLLLFGSALQTVAVFPAAISYLIERNSDTASNANQVLAIVAVFGFVFFFALAFGPVTWVYLFEIFPVETKELSSSSATALNWIGGIIMIAIGIVTPNYISFIVFACLQLLATLFIFFFVKETRGRPLGDSPYMTEDKSEKEVVIKGI